MRVRPGMQWSIGKWTAVFLGTVVWIGFGWLIASAIGWVWG